MLLVNFLDHPLLWLIPWTLQSIGYFFVLKKMNLNPYTAIVPCMAEHEFSTVLMRRIRSFWRPFIIAVIFLWAAYYLGPYEGQGGLFMMAAFLVYGLFLVRLYWRLSKSFDKSIPFFIGMMIIPPLFLLILGKGKSVYHPLDLGELPQYDKKQMVSRKVCFGLISAVEVIALAWGVAYIANQELKLPFLVEYEIRNMNAKISTIDILDSYISREDEVSAKFIKKLEPSREHFYPDHSHDEDVVVFVYMIGSDLEGENGLASINLKQMIDATKQGSHLKFVVEAGGSKRWFTPGISDGSCARYEIENGTVKRVKDLPSDVSLCDREMLEDFLKWGKENYSADRNMLVFWDHGGGFIFGYGSDDLNNKDPSDSMEASEVVAAIDASGLKFDVVGFDACLMQDIELAASLEPYTDYYLASEEEEDGVGWYYTYAFGKLAQKPNMDTEEFLRNLISSYDSNNKLFAYDDGPQMFTLSAVDTTLIKPAYEKLEDLWVKTAKAIEEDPKAFSFIGTAFNNTYIFEDRNGIDLIGYLQALDGIDYDDIIYPHKEMENIIKSLQAGILYRNENTFDGIHGMAFTFPYEETFYYSYSYEQLNNLSLDEESSMFNKIFSIIAYKQKEQDESAEMTEYYDATQESWYEAGFEDYNTNPVILEIPLKETKKGYKIELPEKVWDIMYDCQTMVFQKDKDGNDVYLGSDYIGEDDKDGHPIINFDGKWVHINNQVVCYQAEGVRESDQGDVYYGKVPALLNEDQEILLCIEWYEKEVGSGILEGIVAGYVYPKDESDENLLNSKGYIDLKAGDTLEFMFDTYDGQGDLLKTEPAGKKIRVTKQERLKVKDSKVKPGAYVFSAAMRDVYQRFFSSEDILVTID